MVDSGIVDSIMLCRNVFFLFYYYCSQVPTQARLVPECVPLLLAGFMQIDVCIEVLM